jgi:hypothetical protein
MYSAEALTGKGFGAGDGIEDKKDQTIVKYLLRGLSFFRKAMYCSYKR